MYHWQHATQMGPKQWAKRRNQTGGELWSEQEVFDRLRASPDWDQFSQAERDHAIWYIRDHLGGTAW
jgi:hypothetical protein